MAKFVVVVVVVLVAAFCCICQSANGQQGSTLANYLKFRDNLQKRQKELVVQKRQDGQEVPIWPLCFPLWGIAVGGQCEDPDSESFGKNVEAIMTKYKIDLVTGVMDNDANSEYPLHFYRELRHSYCTLEPQATECAAGKCACPAPNNRCDGVPVPNQFTPEECNRLADISQAGPGPGTGTTSAAPPNANDLSDESSQPATTKTKPNPGADPDALRNGNQTQGATAIFTRRGQGQILLVVLACGSVIFAAIFGTGLVRFP